MTADPRSFDETLRDDGLLVLARRRTAASTASTLVLTSSSSQPGPALLNRLRREHGLRDRLDEAWAACPMDLAIDAEWPVLTLHDPGGELLLRAVGEPWTISRFLPTAIGMVRAVRRLHASGLIHKNIHPGNFFVDVGAGRAWLTGFGLASVMPREQVVVAHVSLDLVIGTVTHMAPEQTGRMNRSIDARSDLYSLGVTLYQMLTGALPFRSTDAMELMHGHMARRAPAPSEQVPGIPEMLSRIVMKLLAKPAEERYQTASGIEADLRACMTAWESHREIAPFGLGVADVPRRLLVPERLYGREADVATLRAAFDRLALHGPTELMLVRGYAGIGKSSVVRELHKAIAASNGLFATGKFDAYLRDVPYATLAQALQSLIRMILSRPELELDRWRCALREAVHPHGQLIASLIPEFEVVIGEQPEVPELSPLDTQARFQAVLRRLLGVFARPEHPLVLFLDDLQWADVATLDLLEQLVVDSSVQSLMLIGSYRDNEVGPIHPLTRTLESLRAAQGQIHEIVLTPLSLADVGRMVADTLRCSPERASVLAQLVQDKTGGNPFFAAQFITELADEGLLQFDAQVVTWTWDMSRIEAKGCADNVVDLMVAKLGRLPTPAQHLLKLLACLGTRASMAGLALVSGVAPEDQPAALQGAVAGGLVLSQAAAFAFAHDRVREAAYALLSGPQRAQDHLHIGRLMLARTEADVLTGFVFEIVDQLNRGAELMTQPEERTRTAELNRLAARRARISTAYASALKYLAAGIGLLDEDAWQQHHALAFDLHLMRSECEFLAGHIEIAEPLLLNLLPHAATPTERAAAYRLLVALHVVRSDYANAVARALECLALLGIDLVAHPSAQQLADAYIDVQRQLEQRSIEAWIDLPPATDPEVEAAMSVLSELFAPACFTDERLAVIHLCRMVGLTLRHGLTPASAQGFAWFGIMLGRYYGRHADGHRFAELSRALVQRHGFAAYEAKSLFSLEIASGWVRPLETVIALSRAAFTAGAERGDVAIACFACHHTVNDALVRGGNLDDIAHDIESGLAFVRQAGFHDVADELVTQQRFVQALRGQTASLETWDGADFDTARFEARFTDGRMPTMIFWHWLIKAQALFIAGQPEQASQALKRAGELTWSAVHVQYLNYPFFSALTLAALAGSDLLAHDKLERLEHIGLHRQQLAVWRDGCPANFADKVALVDAEMARLESRFLDAGRLYQQAADLAREHGFTQNEAIANELAARFYAEQGLRMASHACLRDARYAYSRWGAVAKVRQIDAAFALAPPGASRPEFVTTAIDTSVERLDLATIVRVSQALSGEIQLDRLIDTLLSVVIEHAGAQRGLLILSRGDDWRIEAEGATGDERVSVTVRQSGVTAEVTSKNVPQTVLHYVARTRKSVLLDDASSPNPFVSDAYFLDKRVQEQPPRSVLCLPLLKQTRLVGVLYLENNLAPRVFTPQRLALLELLASQAAISLENARLYADLECENRERRAAETEGSRAQAALQESESRFRRMADATPDVLWITELNPHRVVYASPSFERIWGLAVEDLYREPALWISGIHPDDRGRVDTGFARWTAGSAGAQWDVEFRVVRPDGTLRWIHERGFIISEEHKPQRVSGISTDITERRVAEVALRESQERFALAVAGSNDGIWDWDMLTHQTFMSERGQRLYGLQPGVEVRPHPEWRAMIEYHPDDVLPQREMVEAYLSLRAPAYDGEWRVRHADGAYRWVRIRGLCVRDSAGRATRLTGSITDIDEQKQTEHALRQSEKRHSLAMEASRDGHWDWIIERDEYYVSPRMLEIYGFPQDARFAGRSDFVRQLTFHPEDRARWEKGIAEHFAGTTPRFAIEIRMLRHGVTRWLHFVGLLLRDSSGKPLRWAGSMSDVTDRVAGELALRESEDRFSLAVAASNDGIWEVNLLSDQMFMSERAQQLHGLGAGPTVLPRAEWLAKITFHPADLQTLRDMYIGYLAGQVPSYDGEWRVRHADGSYRWVRIRGLCVRDAQGRALRVAGSVSDIDAQKRAEAALQQAQRLEAVGTLAGGIAHDFNNILGAILGFGEMALRRTRAGSLMRRDIELMLTAGERGRSLVERILAFSRTGVSERVPVHVEGVVREVLNLLRASLPEDVRIESDLRAANAATLGDSTQVHQVLMNLATNAIQAMPEGGVLRVTLTEKRLTDAIVVATGAVAAGEYLVLSVTDTGAGISQEIGHRIFDPFFTTKEVGSGTGLGLSLVHGIISELGGAVDVTSTAGAGSTFTAYLPRVDDVGDVAGPAEDEPVVVARGAHEQILLVDDEEPLVRLMTDTLSDIGYVVVGFTSSLDALAAFTAHPDRFDAVVTDERMPGLSGTALIRAVREIRPSIPVLLASGYVGADVAERARAAGADAVLSKPLAAAELAGALARVLRSRAPVWAQVII